MTHLYQGHLQTVDASGVPRSGALLYFYQANSTTGITTYQDSGKATPHANPVVADSSGRFAPIWVDTTPYKTVLKTSSGTTIQTEDYIYANNTLTEGRFSIATGSTVDLDATEYLQGDLTNTTTVNAITLADGNFRIVRALSTFQFTASSTQIVNGSTSVNRTTVAGERYLIEGFPASVVHVTSLGAGGMILNNGQIQFPATQNASSGANVLDDYEEGTFTPGIAFGGGVTGITYTTQVGTYTKIGNRVSFELTILLSNKGSSTGVATVTALPFTVGTSGTGSIVISALAAAIDAVPMITINASATTISLQQLANGSSTVSNLDNTNFGNTTSMIISGHFKV